MLAAWRDSPTRLREDSATEADLVRAGYRDRLLTELAQNAADAAVAAGVPGQVAVRLDGRELRVSNNGAPLDLSGVHALTALRVSDKSDVESVGRFGVGFTAVLAVSEDVEIRSTTGSLRFSRELTRAALREYGIRAGAGPDGADGGVLPPVLRLAWPVSTAPEAGADTEVVLRLRADVDTEALLAAMRAEAVDLLLELPALRGIRLGDDEITSAVRDLGNGLQELRVDGPGIERRIWWQYRTSRARWLLPVRAGRPVPAGADVLRAPTRSDEELSLPALLIADIAMQPDRRRLLPGARLAELAEGYADFAAALPAAERLVLVPAPGFARSEADGLLREALVRELQTHSWLPIVTPQVGGTIDAIGESAPVLDALARTTPTAEEGSTGQVVSGVDAVEPATTDSLLLDADFTPHAPDPGNALAIPARASVFTGLTTELADLLDDVVGNLVIPELSGLAYAEALGVLDVHRLGLARLAELSAGVERPPHWWRSLYAALEPFAVDPLTMEELGALAVPLTDGRLVTGPRTVVLDDRLDTPIRVHWARLVHPEAMHPLLSRLGARSASPEDLLNDPALHAELADNPGDEDTADAVLQLAASVDPAVLPTWLNILELPDATGELRPVDELLLPDAPLAGLLVADSPFSTVSAQWVDAYGADALRAVGVGWDFGVVTESDPTGPDHDLDDEDRWWSGLLDDPREFAAVRDLDLVADAAWPEALRHLLAEPRTRRLLADRDGYTAWWLRRNARIDGTPLGLFRHPDDTEFADLLPVFDVPGLTRTDADALRAVLADAGVINGQLAAALLGALADPTKTPSPEVVSRTHARLAAAVDDELVDLSELDPPDRVRALSGAVVEAADAFVLDQPWFGLAVTPDRLVVGDMDTAAALATLLDLPLVSASISAEVVGDGYRTTWADEPLAVVLRQLWTLPPQRGELVLHRELLVRLTGAVSGTVAVPWWRSGDTTHIRVGNPSDAA
ncbi:MULTISPECIES: sacsin N-terminal ATP-binding-like domain-containing protein [unclassified Nocardia]|uniref:sacsin N-terminal ATP-binding-like domain-containing protein n=1 Tax=unclassified Nocardia TaxID=2637762 RepID=UPI001CE40E5D|nr:MULTISPECIES: ATP-binding protein [unclassified Nocardia]